MTEREWWSRHIKPRWHRPPLHVAWKVQDYANAGLPDSMCCFRGVTALVELKLLKALPVRASTLITEASPTVEQRRHLDMWAEAGGQAYVLFGIERSKYWYLFPPSKFTDLQAGVTSVELVQMSVKLGEGWASLSSIPQYVHDAKSH